MLADDEHGAVMRTTSPLGVLLSTEQRLGVLAALRGRIGDTLCREAGIDPVRVREYARKLAPDFERGAG